MKTYSFAGQPLHVITNESDRAEFNDLYTGTHYIVKDTYPYVVFVLPSSFIRVITPEALSDGIQMLEGIEEAMAPSTWFEVGKPVRYKGDVWVVEKITLVGVHIYRESCNCREVVDRSDLEAV
jgi:hypothetical protein